MLRSLFYSPRVQAFLTFTFTWLCFTCFLQYWLWERAHVCSIVSIDCLALISFASLSYGAFLLPLFPFPKDISSQRPIQLLFGFFIINTLLFILVILRLVAVQQGFFLVAGIGLVGFFLSFFYQKKTTSAFQEQLPGMIVLLLSGIGATLLCRDPLSIPIHENGMIYFPVWGDSFIHTCFVNAFVQADGLHKISNVYMSGTPLPFYHYASYLMPAAIVSFTHVSAFIIFSCFLIPVGAFLLGLAGFTLAYAFWRGWSAVAATVAVLFLPDAYYQGFQNKFLSYHFHLHVGPANFYGLVCAALAWLFMIQGCRVKKLSLVFGGYLFLGMTLCYKAQLFIATAFVLLLFPCFFFLQCGKVKKMLVACGLMILFIFVIHFSQRFPSVPMIALNGGGIHKYCKVLSEWTNDGLLHAFLWEHLWQHPLSFPWYHLLAGVMLYFCTLGACGLGVINVLFFLRQKVDAIVWSFPCLIIINYLVMSLGLSMDSKHIEHPEELLNRPLVWAYFAVATWTASGFYFLLCNTQPPKTLTKRILFGVMLVGCLMMPLFFAHGVQTMPMWNITLKSNAVPDAMVEALDFIKHNSQPSDIIQGSESDPLCIASSLAERQNYVITTSHLSKQVDQLLVQRTKEVEDFKQMATEEELRLFIKTHPISWYLLRPETRVAWPDSFKNSFVFQSGGYRVYHWSYESI